MQVSRNSLLPRCPGAGVWALVTLLNTTRIARSCVLLVIASSSGFQQALLQRIEAALEYVLADQLRQFTLAAGCAVELGAPLGESAIAIGDRCQLQRRDVVIDAHR